MDVLGAEPVAPSAAVPASAAAAPPEEGVIEVDLRTPEQKKDPTFVSRVDFVRVKIVQPVQPLLLTKQLTLIQVNGSPASGKSTLVKSLRRYVRKKDTSAVAASAVVVLDTDELFAPFWAQFDSWADKPTSETVADMWLTNLHPTFEQFLMKQPEGALVICCGVADHVEYDNSAKLFSYYIPNIPWTYTFFMDIPEDELVRRRFIRYRNLINSKAEMDRLTDLSKDSETSFGNVFIRYENRADRNVYINTLRFVSLESPVLQRRLEQLIDIWLLAHRPFRKRKLT